MDVLVVGAGPTGMTLALALRRRGVACRLVEQAAARSPWSRALAVQARTLDVMERLGIADRFLAAGLRPRGLALHPRGGLGGAETRVDLPDAHPRFPSLIILPQPKTERLLEEAGAAPERGVAFEALEGGEAGAARLRRADGTIERVAADWIVGCDGAHSAVRHALRAGFAGAQYPQQVVLADFAAAAPGLAPDRVHLFPRAEGADRRLVAYFPLPPAGATWRAIAMLPPDAPPPREDSLAPFALPGVAPHEPTWISAFRISRRQVDRARHGRVLLAGDAAHIHSPAGGQGMNLGIQDAWALAAAIAQGGDAAVDAWAAERHAVTGRVLRATDAATRMATAHGALAALLRGAAFGALAAAPFLRRRLARAVSGMDYPPPAP